MKASHSHFLNLRGLRYHLRSWGDAAAPLVVMLHGWGDMSASFQFIVDALRRDWFVLAPDWRGFGLSQGNRDGYWFPDYIADLDALLEQYSPEKPVRLLGHSLGGNVAGLYAGIRPERVSHFISLEGTGLALRDADEAPGRYAKWLEQLRAERSTFPSYSDRAAFARRLQKRNPRLSDAKAAFLAQHMVADCVDAEERAAVRMTADPAHSWVNPTLYRIEEAKACWRQVTAPVLWITARDSHLFREFFAADSEDYRSRLACFRQLREVWLEDSSHNMHHDQPEEVARLMEEFL